MRIDLKNILEDNELHISNIILGPQPIIQPTPDKYGVLYKGDEPIKRFDLYDNHFVDHKAIAKIFQKWAVICFGNHIHWYNHINEQIRSDNTQELLKIYTYFCQIIEYENNLLIATGTHLLKYNGESKILWTSIEIAFDGIIINEIRDNKIYCSCELDPPGGWEDRIINFDNGSII